MRILFADKLPEQTVADLESHGHECVMEPGLHADDLAGADRRLRRAGRAQHEGQGARSSTPPTGWRW